MIEPGRYVKIPVRIYDAQQVEEGLEIIDSLIVKLRIFPFCIESYHATTPEHLALTPENMVSTRVMMKSGDEFIVDLTVDEFEKLLV